MKVMYVASQPDDGAELSIGQEIGLLQSQLLSRNLPNLEFAFYSDLTIEQFRTTIGTFAPDVLHISAHSDFGSLRFRNSNKEVVDIDARKLEALIPAHATPRLLILSSCNSTNLVSKSGHGRLPVCVTFGGRVRLNVASSVVLQMYEEILSGLPLQTVHGNCYERLQIEQRDVTLDVLSTRADWGSTVLYRPPAIVVRLVQKKLRTGKDGKAASNLLEVGLDGAPSDVTQVVFFTDERSRAEEGDYEQANPLNLECWRASRMAKVVYGPPPVGGCLWSTSPEEKASDERIYAVALRGGGSSFIVRSSVAHGLESATERELCSKDLVVDMLDFATMLRQEARSKSRFMDD